MLHFWKKVKKGTKIILWCDISRIANTKIEKKVVSNEDDEERKLLSKSETV